MFTASADAVRARWPMQRKYDNRVAVWLGRPRWGVEYNGLPRRTVAVVVNHDEPATTTRTRHNGSGPLAEPEVNSERTRLNR